ncbi:MAG TPA: phosphoribosylaminoimidazolesuccinocarboxamide synthase [Candidatus Kryptonia bacterium]|nr:phosphoribosylaminoimidazolesuccinocarboxamide synthase [Candidatus Kryptonia bacterium]
MDTLFESNLKSLPLLFRGKVRDIYDAGQYLLLVASDRLSAFDVVLPTPIPEKGCILTELSLFWFDRMKDVVPNHVVSTDVSPYVRDAAERAQVEGRTVVCRKAEPLKIETIVRGYIAGTGWKDYQRDGAICGIKLPAGLRESDKLPEPIFTPSTKAPRGQHDENITFEQAAKIVGRSLAQQVRELSLKVYVTAAEYAETRGIIICDTKFEWGLLDGKLILIDELLTPDSSRFWPRDQWQPGKTPPSFDKQPVRDYLESIGFNKKPPAPELPPEVVRQTTERYREALVRLRGR